MSQQLIDAGVATGYYFVAIFLKNGAAGLQQDTDMALRYYRKAADEGSAQAQAYVAEKLFMAGTAYDVAAQMRRCAAEQGEGEAASNLGINLQGKGLYQEAVEAFQLGVAAGDETSAYALEKGFGGPKPTDTLYYLGQPKDPERASRYKKIGDILSRYSYRSPSVPEINDIVPLPPAPLPAWDGKLKWVETYNANTEPPKPGEALIVELAKAKQLNPTTGRPLPSSPDFDKNAAIVLLCKTGEPCPKSGYWQVVRYEHTGWRLPLYIWSVHPGSWQKGKTTQPVGCCLLPERAKPADINAQLENLAGQLTLPGIQQICLNPEFTFLLDLKRLLSVSAEKICASVSTLLNKYHSLSLAGLPVSLKHRPVMGNYGTDVNGQVLLRLTTTNPDDVRGWLPGGELHQDLMALLHVYLGSHLDVRLQLCVARHLLPNARLACSTSRAARLGQTAVMKLLEPRQKRNDILTIHLGRWQCIRENIHRRESDEDGDYRW